MAEIRKFPNGGFDVTIVSRKDIMQTIKNNIKDPDVVEELIKELEFDASVMVSEGKWVGIPFLGNIRSNPVAVKARPLKDLEKTAYETLTKEQYIMFVKNRNTQLKEEYEAYRFYRYKISKVISKNYKEYIEVAKLKGELYARIYFFAKSSFVGIGNKLVDNIEEEEV